MHCTSCDHANPADARFCTNCGAVFAPAAPTIPLATQPAQPAAAPLAPAAPQPVFDTLIVDHPGPE